MDFRERMYKERIKEGQEVCKKCEGKRYHLDRKIAVATVCEHCRGEGYVYWIDNITGNPCPTTYGSEEARQMAERNAHYLLAEAKRLFYEAGILVLITVEQHKPPSHHLANTNKLFSI